MHDSNEVINSIQKWDRSYKIFLMVTVVITAIVTFIVLAQIYTINNQIKTALINGRKANVQTLNDIKANQSAVDYNLRQSLKCVLLLPRTSFDQSHLNTCFDNQQPVKS